MAAAAVAAGLAFIPCAALASSASPSTHHASGASTGALAKTKSASPFFKSGSSPASKSVRGRKAGAAKPADGTDPDLKVALGYEDVTAFEVQLDVTVTADSGFSGSVAVDWGDGSTSNVAFNGSGQLTPTHTYAKPGVYAVSAVATDNASNTASNTLSVETAGTEYTAYGPTRLLDTRSGTGAPAAQIQRNGTVHLQVGGVGGTNQIPQNVVAVVLNLTVTDTHGTGFIDAYDDGDPNGVPTVSNVNYVAGQTVANEAIVPVGADGIVDLTNGGGLAGGVDLIADVTGYFTAATTSGYTALTPDRLVDTRSGTGAPKHQVTQNGTIAVQIAGQDGGSLPSSGITAVALNVTVTGGHGNGFVTAYPDGTALPNASSVNYSNGQTIANSVIVPVGDDGKIDITDSGAQTSGTDVVVDVVGYYSANGTSAYVPTLPSRYLDTRSWGQGPLDNINGDEDNYIYMPVAVDDNGNVVPGITGVVLNVTVTNTQGNGFLTVAPDPNSFAAYQNGNPSSYPPNSSSLNWVKGATVPNLVQASTGSNGIIDVWNQGVPAGSTDLIVDFFGYYESF